MSTGSTTPEEVTVRHAAPTERSWPLLRHRFVSDAQATLVLAAGFLVAVLVVTALVGVLTEVRTSGWEIGTQLVRWYVGAMGGYATGLYLQLYVAHGWTRRAAAGQSAVSSALLALLVAVLVTVGFAVEGLVYRAVGWPQALGGDHLFATPDAYGWILVEHGLVFLVWVAGGALIGAGFARNPGVGVAVIPVAAAPVVLTEVVVGTGYIGPFPGQALTELTFVRGSGSLALVVPVVVVAVMVLTALTWLAVRDVAIRERAP